jgi:hypothetical protein
MAHHIFRRCLLADVVPPPPVPPAHDYRLVVSPEVWLVLPAANGAEFGTSVGGLDVMSSLFIPPIPPGIDTGLGYHRLSVSALDLALPLAGIEIHGATASGGITI